VDGIKLEKVMKRNHIGMLVAAALGMAATSALAEDMYRGAWYALPGLSYNWTDSDLNAQDDLGGFIRAGKEINDKWDFQVGGSYASIDGNQTGKYKQTLLGVDALYMFSREKLRPFLLVGLGYAHNKVDYMGGSDSSWMANVGAGVQYLVNDNFGLQADVRQVWSEAKIGTPAASSSDTISNTVLNVGAIFRFGGSTLAPVAAAEPTPAPAAATEPAPVPAPVAAAEPCTPNVETIEIQSEALFDFDKAVIRGKSNQALDEVIAKMKDHGDVEFVLVTGHTDRIGSDAYNQKLSERRANAVRKYLSTHGIDGARIKSQGKGESEPVVDCKGVKGTKNLIECLAPNRRVIVDATHKETEGCDK
jgi:OOP family OmpA-OmpF porin